MVEGSTEVADAEPEREFSDYFLASAAGLRSTAYLLCGDWHRAEDILQTAFLKLYAVWPRLSRRDALDGFARRVVVRTFLNENRRLWRRRERVFERLPELASTSDPDVAQQVTIRAALAAVPPRQRAVLVLRYYDDLSVEETATALGCSAGTVKSQSARGLVTLRRQLGTHFAELFPNEVQGEQEHA